MITIFLATIPFFQHLWKKSVLFSLKIPKHLVLEMQNVVQIATNAGHTAQNEGRTAQNTMLEKTLVSRNDF